MKPVVFSFNGIESPGVAVMRPRVIHLEGWSTCRPKFSNPYAAPELVGLALCGIVTGHPRKPDGSRVVTTRIMSVGGRIVRTESGSCYLLGEPSEKFLAYLKSEGRTFDPEAPIKVIGK